MGMRTDSQTHTGTIACGTPYTSLWYITPQLVTTITHQLTCGDGKQAKQGLSATSKQTHLQKGKTFQTALHENPLSSLPVSSGHDSMSFQRKLFGP